MRGKNKGNFMTALTIIVVAVSIPLTLLILQSGNLDLRIKAFDSPEPKNVVVTDVTGDSFRVSWTTEKEVSGGIMLVGSTRAPLLDNEPTSYHSLVVKNLEVNKTYKFRLLSEGEEFSNGLVDYNASTAKIAVAKDNYLVYGQVFSEDGFSFQQGGLITFLIEDNNQRSQVLSQVLNEAGGFQINLDGLLEENLDSRFNYLTTLDLEVKVYLQDSEEPINRNYTIDFTSGRQLPNIYLGDVEFNEIPGINGL